MEFKAGTSLNNIAKKIKRSPSTVSRELKRNKGLCGYRHKQANGLAKSRLKEKAKAIKLTASVKEYINDHLRMDWSPGQIAGRLEEEKSVSIHHETIYQYLLKDKQLGGVLL